MTPKEKLMLELRQCTFILTTCLFLMAASALAGAGYERPDTYIPNGDCLVGNLNPPIGPSYPDVFMGNESYAYYFNPSQGCSCPEDYFRLDTISMMVDFSEEQLPQTLVITPAMYSAVIDPGSGCLIPGVALCVGPDVTFVVNTPGIQTFTLPVTSCGPFPMVGDYFLTLNYMGGGPANLPVDDMPQACVEYINTGAGWADLFGTKSSDEKTGGGKLIVFGDIICVTSTVDVEQSTWGSIKGLYRNTTR